MSSLARALARALPLALLLTVAHAAEDVGQIKVAKGQVSVDRGGRSMPAQVGMGLAAADVVKTGLPATVYLAVDPTARWPERLAVRLPDAALLTVTLPLTGTSDTQVRGTILRQLDRLRGQKDGKELIQDVEESLQFEKMK